MSYFPCPIFRSTDDFSITLQGGSKTFDQDVFLVGIHMYPFEAYDNWLTIEYPNGEKGEKYGLYDNESTYPFIFLPAGTKVTAHNCTINWFYVTWVKVPEMVSGGGVVLRRYLMPLISKITRWRHESQRSLADERKPEDDLCHSRWFLGKPCLALGVSAGNRRVLLQNILKASRSWDALHVSPKLTRWNIPHNLFRSQPKGVLHPLGHGAQRRFFERAIRGLFLQQGRQRERYSSPVRADKRVTVGRAVFSMEAA